MNEKPYRASAKSVNNDHSNGLVITATPYMISTSASADEQLPTLLYRIAMVANAATSTEAAVRGVLTELCSEGRWSAGRIFLQYYRPGLSDRWLVSNWAATPVQQPEPIADGIIISDGPPKPTLAHAAWLQNQAIVTNLSGVDGLQVGIAVPLRFKNQVLGTIELYSAEPVAMPRNLVDTLLQAGELLAQAALREKTHREALQQQQELLYINRLASMGELARNLAHEINQPLAAVVGYAGGALQLLEQGRADPKKLKRALEQVGLQAKRAANITQEIRAFLRRDDIRHEELDLCALVRETVVLLEGAVQEAGIALRVKLPEEAPAVEGDPTQLQQVLINLISNAVESMEDTTAAQRHLLIEVKADDQVELSICDTGGGITEELLPKVFNPFLTTKPNNLGMGLPVSRSIIEFHGGRISADRNSNGGMNFQVRLPLARS